VKTYLDCIPCFFKQALEASRKAGASARTQKKILDEVARIMPKMPLTASPPEIGGVIYALVSEISGRKDPYLKDKNRSNDLALGIYDKLKKKTARADDKLLFAVELAIAGNIIDYGVKNSLNVDEEISKILNKEKEVIKKESKAIFDYAGFKGALSKARNILYLADNAGEAVFDRVLIEEIKSIYNNKEITYAVKEKPVINDALRRDAVDCGIDKIARVVSSGSDAPGTVLSRCSSSFLSLYKKTDMVISKGQGNFEALSETKRPVFFLFMAKCPVIAEDVGCKVGNVILKYHPGGK
jgi:damage-control phosphatase, subfamily I